MKLKRKLLTGLILLSSLQADTFTQISFEQDSDGNINPNIFIPLNWNDNYYSGIGYTASTTKDIDKLDNFTNSKNGMVSSKKDMTLNWITKKIGNYSIGMMTTILKIQNNEFGYINDTDNLFGKGSDYLIAFDNDIELNIIQTGLYMNYQRSLNKIDFRVSTTLYPSRNIDVTQSTMFKPLVAKNGTSSSTTSQNLSYNIGFETMYNSDSFINIGFEYSYKYEPIKYDIAQLGTNGTNYIFKTNTIDTDETTTKYILKASFDKKMLGGLYPTIGFGKVSTETIDNKTNKSTTIDEDIISFGFEKRF